MQDVNQTVLSEGWPLRWISIEELMKIMLHDALVGTVLAPLPSGDLGVFRGPPSTEEGVLSMQAVGVIDIGLQGLYLQDDYNHVMLRVKTDE